MTEYHIDYMAAQDAPIRSVQLNGEDALMDWMRETGAKLWFICVFRYETEEDTRNDAENDPV